MSPFEVILSDGLTVWVNHPTLTHEPKMNYATRVGREVKLVAEAAFKEEVINFTSVFKQGSNSTAIKVGTERLRKLLTDSRLSAKLTIETKVHHLQIQSYKGGGNVYFTISSLGPFSETPMLVVRAVERTYKTDAFQCWQFFDRVADFKHDVFIVEFRVPPAKLHKELFLHPEQLNGGYKVRMVPYTVSGPCRNPSCESVAHSRLCSDVKLVRGYPAVKEAEEPSEVMEE